MDKVFDLREFILMLFKKFKLVLILAVVLALLGGVYGYVDFPKEDRIQTSATATVSLVDKEQDATALSSAIGMVNAYITSDTFYTSLLNELSEKMDIKKLEKLFGGDSTPNMQDVKKVMRIFTRGNIIVAELTSNNKDIPAESANLCIDYIVENVPKYNDTLSATRLGAETINLTQQNNDTLNKSVIKFAVLGFGGGMVLAILLIFFVDVMDLRVKKASDLNRCNIRILSDNMDRAAATLAIILAEKSKKVIILTTSSEKFKSDLKIVGNYMHNSLKRIGINSNVVDTRKNSTTADSAAAVGIIGDDVMLIVCCDNVNTSADTLQYISSSAGVILCEELKTSRTDEIDQANETISGLGIEVLGCILVE